jgi:hypothetical protein
MLEFTQVLNENFIAVIPEEVRETSCRGWKSYMVVQGLIAMDQK